MHQKQHFINCALVFLLCSVVGTTANAQGNKLKVLRQVTGNSAQVVERAGGNVTRAVSGANRLGSQYFMGPAVSTSAVGTGVTNIPVNPKEQPAIENFNKVSQAQLERRAQEEDAVAAAVNRQIFFQESVGKNGVNFDAEKYFAFRTGTEALNSLTSSYKTIMKRQLSEEERNAVMNTFAEVDAKFFYYNPQKVSYMVPRTRDSYRKVFYQTLESKGVKNPVALLQKAHLEDVLTMVDVKLWMLGHNGALPRLQVSSIEQKVNTSLDSELSLAVDFYSLATRVQKGNMPSYLQPVSKTVKALVSPVNMKGFTTEAWLNFTKEWMGQFNPTRLQKRFYDAVGTNPERMYVFLMANDIKNAISANLVDPKAGELLYMFASPDMKFTPAELVSLSRWWVSTRANTLPLLLRGNETGLNIPADMSQQRNLHNAIMQFLTTGTDKAAQAQIREIFKPVVKQNIDKRVEQVLALEKDQLTRQGNAAIRSLASIAGEQNFCEAIDPNAARKFSSLVAEMNKNYETAQFLKDVVSSAEKTPSLWYVLDGRMSIALMEDSFEPEVFENLNAGIKYSVEKNGKFSTSLHVIDPQKLGLFLNPLIGKNVAGAREIDQQFRNLLKNVPNGTNVGLPAIKNLLNKMSANPNSWSIKDNKIVSNQDLAVAESGFMDYNPPVELVRTTLNNAMKQGSVQAKQYNALFTDLLKNARK